MSKSQYDNNAAWVVWFSGVQNDEDPLFAMLSNLHHVVDLMRKHILTPRLPLLLLIITP